MESTYNTSFVQFYLSKDVSSNTRIEYTRRVRENKTPVEALFVAVTFNDPELFREVLTLDENNRHIFGSHLIYSCMKMKRNSLVLESTNFPEITGYLDDFFVENIWSVLDILLENDQELINWIFRDPERTNSIYRQLKGQYIEQQLEGFSSGDQRILREIIRTLHK